MMPRILTEDQERDVVSRYSKDKESISSIARDLSVSIQTVHNTLKRQSVSTRPELAKTRLTDVQRTQVVELCLSSVNVEAAAKLVGISPKSVFRILEKRKIRLPKGRPRKPTE